MHQAGNEEVERAITLREKLWVGLATFGGSGLFPVAPGTAGSVASFVIWAPVVLWETTWWQRAVLVLFIFLVGIPACEHAARFFKTDDPKQAVIDEVAGQGLTLLLAPAIPLQLLVGFVFFRLFDVLKPWPIRWIDRHIHGGLGVMLDDILAGIFALVCLVLLDHWFWGNVGMSWMTMESPSPNLSLQN